MSQAINSMSLLVDLRDYSSDDIEVLMIFIYYLISCWLTFSGTGLNSVKANCQCQRMENLLEQDLYFRSKPEVLQLESFQSLQHSQRQFMREP